MNSDTANLSKASNKKVKKSYQVLYLWQGGSWLVGKTTDSNFQLQNKEFTLQTKFCLNPRARFAQKLSLQAKKERNDQISWAL